jgi:hypothetical protein
MNMIGRRIKLLALLILLSATQWAGCSQQLFDDSNHSQELSRLRYYDDDSAVQTTESRRKTEGMGFGYPTGMGQQQ